MRTFYFYIFFSVIFLIYSLINYYIFIKGWQLIPRGSAARPIYLFIFVLVAISYILGRLLERCTVCVTSSTFIHIGSLWFAVIIYLFLGFLASDFLLLAGRLIRPLSDFLLQKKLIIQTVFLCVVVASTIVAVMVGYKNAATPRVRSLEIRANGKKLPPEGITIAAATDIHLGVIIGNSRLERLVDEINRMAPDVILFAGDIVDEDLAPVIEQNLGETLCGLRAKYGVFAVTGNHEYIGGVDKAVKYLEEHGIRMLRDEAELLGGEFYIVGREDRSVVSFKGKRRKSLRELIDPLDKNKPIILMDHQPFRLDRAEANGVDLLISGHTHHGQLWPINYITGAIYELSYGYKQKGNTHVYVSSGFGTWGPPVRIGTVSEILRIKILPGD